MCERTKSCDCSREVNSGLVVLGGLRFLLALVSPSSGTSPEEPRVMHYVPDPKP